MYYLFSEEQKRMYPYLYAIIHAFWSMDIKWKEDSLMPFFCLIQITIAEIPLNRIPRLTF